MILRSLLIVATPYLEKECLFHCHSAPKQNVLLSLRHNESRMLDTCVVSSMCCVSNVLCQQCVVSAMCCVSNVLCQQCVVSSMCWVQLCPRHMDKEFHSHCHATLHLSGFGRLVTQTETSFTVCVCVPVSEVVCVCVLVSCVLQYGAFV